MRDNINKHQLLTTEELSKIIKKSRVTIQKYIKKGMPVIKKGRNNFFNLAEVKAWLNRQQISMEDDDYNVIMNKAISEHPGDPLGQIEYLSTITSNKKIYTKGMLEIVDNAFIDYYNSGRNHNRMMCFRLEICDFLNRGLMFASRKIIDEEPFVYISMRIEPFIKEMIEQLFPYKYKKLIFETFFEQTEETMEEFEKKELNIEEEDYNEIVANY